jgi:hypothetical protein
MDSTIARHGLAHVVCEAMLLVICARTLEVSLVSVVGSCTCTIDAKDSSGGVVVVDSVTVVARAGVVVVGVVVDVVSNVVGFGVVDTDPLTHDWAAMTYPALHS